MQGESLDTLLAVTQGHQTVKGKGLHCILWIREFPYLPSGNWNRQGRLQEADINKFIAPKCNMKKSEMSINFKIINNFKQASN